MRRGCRARRWSATSAAGPDPGEAPSLRAAAAVADQATRGGELTNNRSYGRRRLRSAKRTTRCRPWRRGVGGGPILGELIVKTSPACILVSQNFNHFDGL